MTTVTINWIAKSERAASFKIPEGFEPSDVVAYFEDMGVHQHEHVFLETNAPNDEFYEELGSTSSTQAHDLTEELTSWKAEQNTQIPEPSISGAMDTICIAINGYLEDCIAGSDHKAEQEQLEAAWSVIKTKLQGKPEGEPEPKSHVYVVRTETSGSDDVKVFTDDTLADAHAMAWLTKQWDLDYHGPQPEDVDEAIRVYQSCDNEDFIWYERHDLFDPTASAGAVNIIRDLNAENGNLREQIHQMKGLFSDVDGAIAQALEDAGATASRAHQFLETVKAAEKAG